MGQLPQESVVKKPPKPGQLWRANDKLKNQAWTCRRHFWVSQDGDREEITSLDELVSVWSGFQRQGYAVAAESVHKIRPGDIMLVLGLKEAPLSGRVAFDQKVDPYWIRILFGEMTAVILSEMRSWHLHFERVG